jgi:hypothetical protein
MVQKACSLAPVSATEILSSSSVPQEPRVTTVMEMHSPIAIGYGRPPVVYGIKAVFSLFR